ncbi:MAG TPA: Fe-S cluster assembly protein SufD [Acidimicrobiales bacterium]|nr:Fe-S cluster assembly protein SufD [Acidimicrobiales bacterium]
MTAFTADAVRALGGPEWFVAQRMEAFDRFSASALPTEAEEIWRYSGIDRFDLDRFAPVSSSGPGSDVTAAHKVADRLGDHAALVVTRNGVVVSIEAGAGVPGDVVRVAGSGPLATPMAPLALGEADGEDAFSLLHHAFVADIVTIDVPARVALEAPVVVVHLCDVAEADEDSAPAVFPHTVVTLGEGAAAGVVEVVVAPATHGHAALVVPVSQLDVGERARLAYANLQVLSPAATHIGRQTSRVAGHGEFRSFTVGLGGAYARVRTDSDLVGEGGRSSLLAAYLGTGAQVHDFRTLQDHHAPRTESELLFTGAVADHARSVYSGLIRIRRGARRADARQTNHNLVLSEGAHADSVPNLDIDENDVKCSHASTVGPIDEEQRYYLESRGIEPAVAERLIVRGFFSDLAARSPFADVGRWVEASVEERLIGRLPAETDAEMEPIHG